MNATEALKFSEIFSTCNPQIFSSFPDFPEYSYQTNQYIVFIKASSLDHAGLCIMEAFAKEHCLEVKQFGLHLMLYSDGLQS